MRAARYTGGMLLAVFLFGVPVWYWQHTQAQFRSFRVVRDGVLYRSGQMTVAGLKQVLHDYGIKTVITLRDAALPGQETPALKEEVYCNSQEIKYCRIPLRHWGAPDGSVPAREGVATFLEVLDDPNNYPVLVHCFAGVHRTGAYCAVYRMEYEKWTNPHALAEVKACGYCTLDEDLDLLDFLETYVPRWARPPEPESPSEKKVPAKAVKQRKKTKKVPGEAPGTAPTS